MKLKIGEREYNIKFGYKPTLKSRIISKLVRMSATVKRDGGADMEKMEDLLLFLPELLLAGLQVCHEEFRYDYDTGEGREEQLDEAFALTGKYMDSENADVMTFFYQLQEALLQDSFLKGLFRKEQKKQEAAEERERGRQTAAEMQEKN